MDPVLNSIDPDVNFINCAMQSEYYSVDQFNKKYEMSDKICI